tara:strand:- start:1082 stop:1921 length:840 start_codon:yes stop_codon:yes gene_type:complete
MALSGSFDFDVTTNDIIELAYKMINRLPDGQVLTSEQVATGKKVLNMFIKSLRADGIFLWQQDFLSVPLVASSVVLGSDGNDYECIRNHTASADTKPITGSQYTSYWKKLSTSAGSAWVDGTSYTSINELVLNTNIISIEDGIIRHVTDQTNTKMNKITKSEYINRFDSNSTGVPIQYFFKRETTPKVFLYPYPESTNYVIEFTVNRYPEDFDVLDNNPDFFQEWHEAIYMGLAERLAIQAGIVGQELRDIQAMAFRALEAAKYADNESGILSVSPRLK